MALARSHPPARVAMAVIGVRQNRAVADDEVNGRVVKAPQVCDVESLERPDAAGQPAFYQMFATEVKLNG
jgi:hypothetical protein